jgi:hypothetical protein
MNDNEILAALKALGSVSITVDSYIYYDTEDQIHLIEKPDRQAYPVDQGFYGGAYLTAFAWGDEQTMVNIARAGGNVNQYNLSALRKLL